MTKLAYCEFIALCSLTVLVLTLKQVMGCKKWKNCPNTWDEVTCHQCRS